MSRQALDLTGQRFGKWRVVGRLARDRNRQARWKCLCDCGQIGQVYQHRLTTGTSRSCGICVQQKRNRVELARTLPPLVVGGASAALFVPVRDRFPAMVDAMRGVVK